MDLLIKPDVHNCFCPRGQYVCLFVCVGIMSAPRRGDSWAAIDLAG